MGALRFVSLSWQIVDGEAVARDAVQMEQFLGVFRPKVKIIFHVLGKTHIYHSFSYSAWGVSQETGIQTGRNKMLSRILSRVSG